MDFIKNPTPQQIAEVEARVSPAKRAEIKGLCQALAPVVRDYIGEAVKPLLKEIERLREAIAKLEARPELKYLGTWSQEKVYGTGNFVTEGGSVWHAQRASVGERPGTGDGWITACIARHPQTRLQSTITCHSLSPASRRRQLFPCAGTLNCSDCENRRPMWSSA